MAITLKLALFFFVFLSATNNATSTRKSRDRIPLLAFRDGLANSSRRLLHWDEPDSSSLCSWTGVSCNEDGITVRALNLSAYGLEGKLAPELGELRGIVSLDMSYNSLSGQIPPELSNCSRLQTLFLNNNHFSGSIPPELFGLTELVNLDLGHNFLRSTIPLQIGKLKKLEFLGLYDNYLSGSIPK